MGICKVDLGNGVFRVRVEAGRAIDLIREQENLTRPERRRLNAAMDDVLCEVERLKLAHQRLLERVGPPQGPSGIV